MANSLELMATGAASLVLRTMGISADWISAICPPIVVVVALLTLIALCFASVRILTRHRLGPSAESLGPWAPTVVSPSVLPMNMGVMTPTLNVPLLVAKDWKPVISIPAGSEHLPKSTKMDLEASRMVRTETSWVKFFEALGIRPGDDRGFYQMRYESKSVNGTVPVRWKGPDLAAICSILGFQSIKSKPNTRELMELPTQWSGPLGWLQFRASSDGCIVKYRRRSVIVDQIPLELHNYYRKLDVKSPPFKLRLRLWQSIGGMCFSDDQVIYLSDTSEKMRDRGGNAEGSVDAMCEEHIECQEESSGGELVWRMFGKKSNRHKGPRESRMSQLSSQFTRGISDLLRSPSSDMKGTKGNSREMIVLRPFPGHLSVALAGELVHSRGLENDRPYEYTCSYTDKNEVDKVCEHKLGRLCMDTHSLGLMKKAVLRIQPDGFYFSPSRLLNLQLAQIWSCASSISETSPVQHDIFPISQLNLWVDEGRHGWPTDNAPERQLYNAIKLINYFQSIKSASHATFTAADMVLISRASASLRGLIGPEGMDLIWAILASPKLFGHLADRITHTTMQDLLYSRLSCKSGRFNFSQMKCSERKLAADEIKVELVGDGTFRGIQVVAAFMDVFLNFFWIDSGWVTDVALYDTTMPQSVMMC
ncbi:hypothetical protein HOY80DRAFT_785304 [Tuber brumale]|nr:hypothetical protein HOY80DRAFT_785304 [Tuber brumale]